MLNKVILIGRLGGEPDFNSTQNGLSLTKFNLATSEKFTDKATGNKREETEWHRIVMFGGVAEIARDYLHKGDLVFLEGKLKSRNWEKDGIKRYTTEIIASEMKMLGGNNKNVSSATDASLAKEAADSFERGSVVDDTRNHKNVTKPKQEADYSYPGSKNSSWDDDDIPF